ncbi:HesA/MoeB/ThiF family protein [Pelodictyon luteolum]|uniref:Molybdopterin-synthase adenylyltransferase n=1 Tax=Chlorobium luteolum (strain DSM 273 / BCRC 81028 / 2530) TaxID=319225 RepID=Q3B2L0_CHLL3|nr:HesA/MoeB/ThiF family protein [Pelodictyon luteolum]ABB24421.1 thiamine biosynthesis protein ThiF [Pelodictyon luteolum DSM 273]
MNLSAQEQERYSRHLALPEIGMEGQQRLRASRVLIVGAGGLGSPAALYLSAAGVGTIGLIDGDTVDLTNLQRQILHTTASVGIKKVDSARECLMALNPNQNLHIYPFRLSSENAGEIVRGYDFVVDATDSFGSKFLISRACHATRKPYSHAGITRFFGQAMTVIPGKTTCCHCIFHEDEAPPEAAPEGPLGAMPGVIGSIQAIETIKVLLAIGTPLYDTLLTCNTLTMEFRRVTVRRDPRCPLCGTL